MADPVGGESGESGSCTAMLDHGMRNARSVNTRLALVLLLGSLVASCSRDYDPIPERYRYLRGEDHPDLEKIRARLPFERIERSEDQPMGTLVPTLVLERFGTATRRGTPTTTGQVSIFDFGSLCWMIERVGFESLQPRYAWGGFDASTVTLKIWRVGSEQPIVVEDYGDQGPQEFWELCAAIEGVASRIDWK